MRQCHASPNPNPNPNPTPTPTPTPNPNPNPNQVLKDIFNPWFHAYRLLVQCATAQEAKSGVPFRQDGARALASTNTMDRWILAAANGANPNPGH